MSFRVQNNLIVKTSIKQVPYVPHSSYVVTSSFIYNTATLNTSLTVPAGMVTMSVIAWGAGGGGGDSTNGPYTGTYGGGGGFASASFSVISGQLFIIQVGSSGRGARTSVAGVPGGSWDGSTDQGTGAGYSGIFTGSVSQVNAYLIAGGGAGGGRVSNGTNFNTTPGTVSGGGQTSAGGSALQATSQGGGGYVGGAGTGGSSFVKAGATNVSKIQGGGSFISQDNIVANSSSTLYPGSSVGVGGVSNTNGNTGYLKVIFSSV